MIYQFNQIIEISIGICIYSNVDNGLKTGYLFKCLYYLYLVLSFGHDISISGLGLYIVVGQFETTMVNFIVTFSQIVIRVVRSVLGRKLHKHIYTIET